MSFLGSLNPINLAATTALAGVTGGTSLLLQQALRAVVSNIGQQVIQNLGQQMGLPQGAIDLAQGAFAGSVGDFEGASRNYQEVISDFGQQVGATPFETGETTQIADMLNRMTLEGTQRALQRESGGDVSGAKGGSLLMKIAIALGSVLDQKMTEMDKVTTEMGNLGTLDNKNQSKMGELGGRLQGLSQEVNILSNAMTNSIKTIGEAGTTMARKG